MSQSKKELLSSEQKFQQRVFVVRIALSQGTQAAVLRSGVPERSVRRWKASFKALGLDGLRDLSRAPKRVANKKDLDGSLGRALADLNKTEPGLTRIQVLAKLTLEPSPDTVALSWIARTRKRLGLTRKKRHKKNEHTIRYEIAVPGFLQIDTKVIAKDGEPGEKLTQFTAIDECSRVRFLSGELFKSAENARKFLQDAVKFYASLGVTVVRAQTDHGTEFTLPENEQTIASYARGETDEALFTKECRALGLTHRLIKVRTPQLNGKVERSHKTDEERFYSRFRFATDTALDHALKTVWMPEYNELRPHSALGGMTPMDFLRKKLKEIEEDKKIQETKKETEEKKAA
jgi:transposase InsO family protein